MEKYYNYFSDLFFLELFFLATGHDKVSNSFECMEKVLQFLRFTFFLDFFFKPLAMSRPVTHLNVHRNGILVHKV
jgi:hypothetical protein